MAKRLENHPSLYLRQHANNPVDWWTWGEEAFAEARARDLPLFISIGYAACHWCHVMERETFEDIQVAKLINASTIPIKIDREERPDIDSIYMEALLSTTGGGGWPMTIFAHPDGKPFFTGTYFPPKPRHNMPSFTQLLDSVTKAWNAKRDQLLSQAEDLLEAIRNRTILPSSPYTLEDFDPIALMQAASSSIKMRHDPPWGGFSTSPKFPQPYMIEFLFASYYLYGDKEALEAGLNTLSQMACGGIHDHLGGGFARYSTDRFWMVPHFEKMLYDQAGLLGAYVSAYQLTKSEDSSWIIEELVRYVIENLSLPGGGIATAQDADSEGEEGAYYVFEASELQALLGSDTSSLSEFYGVTPAGNFEGRNILHRPLSGSVRPPTALMAARSKLEQYRSARPRPAVDDKVVSEFNASFLRSLFKAAAVFSRDDWLEYALNSIEFLDSRFKPPRGLPRILGAAGEWTDGFAQDYAQMVLAHLGAYSATGIAAHISSARNYAEILLERFINDDSGAVTMTSRIGTETLLEVQDNYDGATPCTSTVVIEALVGLGQITGEDRFLQAGAHAISYLSETIAKHPGAFPGICFAIYRLNGSARELVIPGKAENAMVRLAQRTFLPDTVLAWGENIPGPLFADKEEGMAYLCEGYVCKTPVATSEELQPLLRFGRSSFAPQPVKEIS